MLANALEAVVQQVIKHKRKVLFTSFMFVHLAIAWFSYLYSELSLMKKARREKERGGDRKLKSYLIMQIIYKLVLLEQRFCRRDWAETQSSSTMNDWMTDQWSEGGAWITVDSNNYNYSRWLLIIIINNNM